MNVNEWLNIVGYKKTISRGDPMCFWNEDEEYEIWFSKHDDSFITFDVLEDDIKFLADKEITEELTNGLGFSPKQNKWYGWSHRAIYGFTIGSTCKRGDCHYLPRDKDEFLDNIVNFWKGRGCVDVVGHHTKQDGVEGVSVKWDCGENDISGTFDPYPNKYGKGEWVAETMEDAKQMAIDFREGVS